MAVETTVTSANFVGTGASATYAPDFYINTSDQVRVFVDGVLQVIGDDYSVNNVGVPAGCNIVAVFPLGSAVYIERQTPITQLVDTQNNETILEDVLDASFDKLTMIAQEIKGKADRATLVPRGEQGGVLPPLSARAGKFLSWDAFGAPIAASGGGGDSGLRTDLLASAGSTLVGWIQTGVAAILRTIASKLFDIPISPLDFDSTAGTGNATNDTLAINRALAASAATRRPVIIDRPYLINGTLVRPAGSEMFGTTMAVPLLVLQAGNYDLFQFTGSWTQTWNLRIDGALRTSGYDINFDLVASAGDQVEHRFKDMFITDSTGSVKDTYVSGAAVVYRLYFNNVKWARQRGHGVRLTRGFAFIYFDHECIVEYIGTTSPNWTAFYYDGTGLGAGAGGLHLGISLVGTAGAGATNTSQIGFDIRNAAAVFFMERARAENMGGPGAVLTSINGLDLGPLLGIYHCNDDQVRIVSCTQVTGSVDVIGRVGFGVAAAGKHGLAISGSDNLDLTYVGCKSCTGHGLNVSTSTVVEIGKIAAKRNTLRGINTDANGVVGVKGGVIGANTAGNYTLGGALHCLRSVTLNSGSCVDVTGAGSG